MQPLDFLAIGDTVIDAFIRINDAHIHELPDEAGKELCLRFGDKVPYESVTVIPAVGNSANAAVAASRLGLSSGLITWFGADQHGQDCLTRLAEEKVATDFITTQDGKQTNYHYVLWYDNDRTILIKHEAFDYALPAALSAETNPNWVYLSSLGEQSLPFHSIFADYLEANPAINVAFQPGTFQMKFGTEALTRIYKRTKVFFCNVEEAERILNLARETVSAKLESSAKASHIVTLMQKLHDLGPELVVVTDGPDGAYLLENDQAYFLPAYPDTKPPLERTGAGDAFASTFVAALSLGKTPQEALLYGPINSMSVVQEIGAQKGLLSQTEIEKYLTEAPSDYAVTNLS